MEALAHSDDSEVKHSISDQKRKPVTLTVLGEETDDDIRRATRVLEKSLRRERERAGGGRDPRGTGQISPVRVQSSFSERLEKIAGLFGKKIVFVKDNGTGFFVSNGVVTTSHLPEYIFINVKNDYNPVAVLGHELLHHLRADRPHLYKNLKNVLFLAQ